MYMTHDFCSARPPCYCLCIQIECTGAIVANMSKRELGDRSLARLKGDAAQEGQQGSSPNTLVVSLLQGADGVSNGSVLQRFDDLNALADTWSEQEAGGFERNTAAFSKVDATLWK